MMEQLLLVCYEKFLNGEDSGFDYTQCDNDGSLCDREEGIDAESRYFDEESEGDDL